MTHQPYPRGHLDGSLGVLVEGTMQTHASVLCTLGVRHGDNPIRYPDYSFAWFGRGKWEVGGTSTACPLITLMAGSMRNGGGKL